MNVPCKLVRSEFRQNFSYKSYSFLTTILSLIPLVSVPSLPNVGSAAGQVDPFVDCCLYSIF